MKTKTLIILIVLFLSVNLIAAGILFCAKKDGKSAEISVDGEVVRTIDLSTVKEAERFEIRTEYGVNVITVEPGRICVSDADCRDHYCVRQGWLSTRLTPIVCMPHKLMIRIIDDDSQVDAVAE